MGGKRRGDDPIEQYLLSCIQAELEKKWREKEDRKGISKDAHLKIELSKLPAQWIQAIYHELGYVERISKDEQIWHITYILSNAKFLEKILVELSRSSLFILKYLLSKGGWVTFQSLSQQANTDESGDSWWWIDDPPSSPLGQLRARGLVFVGRAPVKNRLYKIAVIPRELRDILSKILPRVYHLKDSMEERAKWKESFLPSDKTDYMELIKDIESYFENFIDEPFMLKQRHIIMFLEYLREEAISLGDIEQAWEDIQCFIDFIQHFSFGKTRLEDFKIWDFSYFISKFIPQEYGEPLTYEEAHRVLHNITKLYRILKEKGEVESDIEIQKAISRIIRKDGKITRIPSPPAKGYEILLRMAVAGSKDYVSFTNNDLWSTIILCLEYNEDWQAMISDLEEEKRAGRRIVDAKGKRNHLTHLRKKMQKSRITPYTLLCYLKPDRREIDRAIRWFYKRTIYQGEK